MMPNLILPDHPGLHAGNGILNQLTFIAVGWVDGDMCVLIRVLIKPYTYRRISMQEVSLFVVYREKNDAHGYYYMNQYKAINTRDIESPRLR